MDTAVIGSPGANMVTRSMIGSFCDGLTTRREFLAMIGTPRGGSHGS